MHNTLYFGNIYCNVAFIPIITVHGIPTCLIPLCFTIFLWFIPHIPIIRIVYILGNSVETIKVVLCIGFRKS